MEEERQQSIVNNDEGGNGDSANSLTNCENIESSPDNKTEPEDTMDQPLQINQSRTIEEEQQLKLIVRSQYWGRELKGRTCRNVHTYMNVKAPLVITSQAVLYNTDGFWGCCPAHGKRVLELQEYHFSDVSEGCNWDLYLVGTWVSPTQSVHDFFLLPQNQTSVDIARNETNNGWSFFGTCDTGMIRSGIDRLLRGLLQENDTTYGHRYHHVHIDIMMDKAFDRETPRSRKLNNEKARAGRKKSFDCIPNNYERQESSVTTEGETASTEQETPPPAASKVSNATKSFATKVVGAAPPIPRLITNDSLPYVVPMSCSIVNQAVGYQDARWAGETAHWSHDQFSIHSRAGLMTGRPGQLPSGEHHGLQWYPAKGIPLPGGMSHPHSYWHHPSGTPFATASPQPYYHPQDVRMHQYQVGIQHALPHHLGTELQHGNMVFPENQYYAGIHSAPESALGVEAPVMGTEMNGGNTEFLAHQHTNASTSDPPVYPPSPPGIESFPPSGSATSSVSVHLDTAEIPPVTATKSPSIVPSDDSGMTPGSPSAILNPNIVGVSPGDASTSAAAATELRSIPTPSQLLIATGSES